MATEKLIPELSEIENTDFVDNFSITQCEILLTKLKAHNFNNSPFLAAMMPDGTIIESSYVIWDGADKIKAVVDLTKNCLQHYIDKRTPQA